jgi:alpha-beta hydrolase superfamily lysophospholipase
MQPEITLTSEIIALKKDYEGEVSAAIEYSVLPAASTAVLYIHGYMDYFFQHHLAGFFLEKGISFYAIELRKYGSSIKKHHHQNYFKNISEYDEEISIVINKIKNDEHENIVINGHSTGGLLATHYALNGEYKHLISGVILNSPFLEFNISKLEKFILPFAASFACIFPYLKASKLSSIYTQSLHKDYKGRWEFNLNYKPVPSFVTYLGWVRGILNAHNYIQKRKIKSIPSIIFHSDKSYFGTAWSDLVYTCDAVLNVDDIAYFGRKIYPHADIVTINNAVHDIVLSSDEVIENYFNQISAWLKKNSLQ